MVLNKIQLDLLNVPLINKILAKLHSNSWKSIGLCKDEQNAEFEVD